MHRSRDTATHACATLVLKPNSGWLSKTPIQKAQISLKIKSCYVVLIPATIFILSIYFTYEVKKLTLLSKIYEKTSQSADFFQYYLHKMIQNVK